MSSGMNATHDRAWLEAAGRIHPISFLKGVPLPDTRRARQNCQYIAMSRSALLGSFRNVNECKHALYTSHGVMLFACIRCNHFFG